MDKNEIKDWAKGYILEQVHLEVDEELSLLDPRNGLMPRDLVLLFFALEEKYNVQFEENDIIDGRFDYLDHIADSVMRQGN